MRTITLATAAAFIALANPASAQLLGGGLGGALGGMGAGSIGSSVSRPIGSITNDTVGSASGAGNVDTSHNVDRRSGKRVYGAWPTNEAKPAVIWEAFKPETEPRRTIRKDEMEDAQRKAAEAAARARARSTSRDSDFLQREGGIY